MSCRHGRLQRSTFLALRIPTRTPVGLYLFSAGMVVFFWSDTSNWRYQNMTGHPSARDFIEYGVLSACRTR